MGDLFNWPPSWATLLLLPALFVAFTVHELAHALVAYLLGDTSQVERKRLSFNPLRHVSWVGMAAFLLVGLGWAKPVWVDHTRFRIKNPALGMFLVSVAGAAANLLTALLALLGISATGAIVWMLTGASPLAIIEFLMAKPGPDLHGLAVALSYYMMMVNFLLALFNLLPFPFFDGFQALMSLVTMIRSALRGRRGQAPAPVRAASWRGGTEAGPSPAQIHLKIGLDYHKEGQLDEAIARYRQATGHDERLGLAYYNLGLAHWAKGRLPPAISAFRAAARSKDDLGLSIQADLRVRELRRAEQDPAVDAGPAPPPLEPGASPTPPLAAAQALDPDVARQVWLRLSIGGAVMVALALAMWVFVTVVALGSVG
jgi:Zn-dependent protease